MRLSQATLEELRAILHEDYDWDASDGEVEKAAIGLVGCFTTLAEAVKRELLTEKRPS